MYKKNKLYKKNNFNKICVISYKLKYACIFQFAQIF